MLATFIALYIVVNLAVGFWAARRVKSTKDYTLAGRGLSTALVGVTLFATWFSASSIMGNPGLIVENGLSSLFALTFTSITSLGAVALFYARKLYRMNIVTIGDFFQIRFTRNLDRAVSVIMVLSYPSWIAAQYVALSFLFQNLLGVTLVQGVFIGAVIVVAYTYIGGMWAVSYTDMLQSVVILIGLGILLVDVLGKTGGIMPVFADKPAEFFSIFPSGGFSAWNEYFAIIAAYTIGSVPLQEIYQRVFSAKSEKAAINGLFLAAVLLVVVACVPQLIALGAETLHPELMGDDQGQNIIPSWVSLYASLPVQVLFYGAIISAILSTSSGAMLAPATVIGKNLIKPYFPKISDRSLLLSTRLSVILVAGVSCYFALMDANIVGLVVASISLVLVCVFAPLTFGLFWSKASVFGAWAAIWVGAATWLGC